MRGVQFDPERLEVRRLVQRTPLAGARVLEIGCGDGRLTRRIARLTRHIHGIDPDAAEIRQARRRAVRLRGKARFDVGHAERLPFGDHRFDIVLYSWSL